MFGIGWTEFIIIALVLLIFVGPKNLPPLFRKIGTIVAEFKNASRELRNQIDMEVADLESPRQIVRDIGKDILDKAANPYEEIQEAERKIKEADIKMREGWNQAVEENEGDGDSEETGSKLQG